MLQSAHFEVGQVLDPALGPGVARHPELGEPAARHQHRAALGDGAGVPEDRSDVVMIL